MKNVQKVETRVAYICGRFERELEAYAVDLHITSAELTQRVVEFLLPERARIEHTMPYVPEIPAKHGKTLAKVEVAVSPHSKRTPGGVGKNKISSKQKAYWAKMTKKQRSAEVLRRLQKRKSQIRETGE